MDDPQNIAMNEDEGMIPVWSMVAAGAAFIVVEYYFWMIAPAHRWEN